ncbi:phosphoribosylglycinamide formyltransferase [Arenibacter aquaticus]|uniref:phosphoribosylglycinamide formyltransferase 1 n=1 Tax=Arenibacter aquaticus TaxID=2489054 RepID=A0A3S0C7I8_9FLAO|nr:formyltransferase family protein [Arenibacter aquaticus]RTE53806.1 phosphoribosylglycinamide formyltransferase [Arenibacter aquaticus]
MDKQNHIQWAILCTGWGRNAKDIIKALHKDNNSLASRINLLIYGQEPCGAAEEAKKHEIETLLVRRSDFPTMEAYQNHILLLLKKKSIDRVFLLNYKYRIREALLQGFPNRIYNVHPSLFPSFLGTKTAIQDALDYGVKITGITTHIIDHELDKGTILQQQAIKIKAGDTFETLYPKFAKKGKKIILRTMRDAEQEVRKPKK